MISGNEAVTLLLGVGVLIFLVANRDRLSRLPAHRTFVVAFLTLEAGWLATVLEGCCLPHYLNLFEHVCYSISSTLIFWWCWQVFIRRKSWC